MHIDTNCSIDTKTWLKHEEELKQKWTIHKCDSWTRKGTKNQQNTNIDIILTSNVMSEKVNIKWLPHIEKLSDHKPIQIEILC